MKAIVTGAKGFIGSALCAALRTRGYDVWGVDIDGWDRPPPEQAVDAVFYHLAWVGKAGPLRADWRVQVKNVEMALTYFELAKKLSCRCFVCAGTIGEKMLLLPECVRLKSQNRIYVNTKLYLHRLLENLEQGCCHVVWATLGNMYGIGTAGGSILDYALQTLLNGENAIFGPAEQPYDFVNIKDAIRALILLGEHFTSVDSGATVREYYIGNGAPRPLKEWLSEVGEIVGRPELIKIGGRPDDGTRFRCEWFSIAELVRDTGFQPLIKFSDGIRENVKWLTSI